jgi:hypothetical protein
MLPGNELAVKDHGYGRNDGCNAGERSVTPPPSRGRAAASADGAVVVAGPIVNLPSLLVLGRETSPRLAASLAAAVWGVASVAGIFLSL